MNWGWRRLRSFEPRMDANSREWEGESEPRMHTDSHGSGGEDSGGVEGVVEVFLADTSGCDGVLVLADALVKWLSSG